MKMLKWLFCLLVPAACLVGNETVQRAHIPYLIQRGNLSQGLELYRELRKDTHRHDFEILSQMATLVLQQGAKSADQETQLLTLFGAAYATHSVTLSIVESALSSKHPQAQLAAVHLMEKFDHDRCHYLLGKAMNSPFLGTRMEAAHQLCVRKDRKATGQIEALMYRCPQQYKFYFPSFFGLIGTRDGTKILTTLLDDKDEKVRVAALHSSAKNSREELLPTIRKMATHPGILTQEACAYALGKLGDTHGIDYLKRLQKSKSDAIRISAAYSLYQLGDIDAKRELEKLAQEENLFAISLLGSIPETEEVLAPLLKSKSPHVRFGSAKSLLKLRDERAVPILLNFLIKDTRDLGFSPHSSPGRTLNAWKVVSCSEQYKSKLKIDIPSITQSVKENLLIDAVELSETTFLSLAGTLFNSRQFDLIPLLVRLVENLNTDAARALLKTHSTTSTLPLVRAYCTLSLFRQREVGPFEAHVHSWVKSNQSRELIQFKPPKEKGNTLYSPYELTPSEESKLLIETCEALAEKKDDTSIDLILDLFEKGNPKNHPLLAGLLLKALQ